MKNRISPSLICTNPCFLQQEVKELEAIGCEMLHIDIIDGRFSPDMPLGIGTVKQLRKYTNMIFDVHLMSVENAPYIDLLLETGADRICFHTEYEARPSIMLRKIKAANIKAGIAISPETALETVKHLFPLCDFVLIMRIDPGYAHLKGQDTYPFADEKISQLRSLYPKLEIEVDGRVDFEDMPKLLAMGANTFVSGTKGLFSPENSRSKNFKLLENILKGKNNYV